MRVRRLFSVRLEYDDNDDGSHVHRITGLTEAESAIDALHNAQTNQGHVRGLAASDQ